MDKIKKIGTGLLIVTGFTFAIGWSVMGLTPVAALVTNAVQIIPEPRIDNPVPRCSECLINRGLNPKCLNICLQEVMFPMKPTLEFLAGQ